MEHKKIVSLGKGLGLVGIGYGIIATTEKVMVALSRACELNPSCYNEAMILGLVALAIIGAPIIVVRLLKK